MIFPTRSRSIFNSTIGLLLLAVSIKLVLFFFFVYSKNSDGLAQGIFYSIEGDAYSYVEPVENLLKVGEHRINNGSYSLRMPGYTPFYLAYRIFLSQQWALNLTLLTQAILSGISCYVLALLSFRMFHSIRIFYMVFIVYTVSTYVSVWDTYILTESFATSSLIFSCYFIERALSNNKVVPIILGGLFLTWSIFLRPFLLPVFALFITTIAIHFYRINTLTTFRKLSLLCYFLIPFLLIDSAWTLRNYRISNEFIPLQSRMTYNDGEMFASEQNPTTTIADLVRAFGGDHAHWNPKGESYWFFNNDEFTMTPPFPDQLYNDTLTLAHLEEVKRLCIATTKNSMPDQQRAVYVESISSISKTFYNSYKINHPIHYYITSRLIHLKKFIIHSGVYNLPFPAYKEQAKHQTIIKLFYAILYLGITCIGLLMAPVLIVALAKNEPSKAAFFTIPLYLTLLFPIILKMHEFRFNTLAYPFLLVSALYGIDKIQIQLHQWFRRSR